MRITELWNLGVKRDSKVIHKFFICKVFIKAFKIFTAVQILYQGTKYVYVSIDTDINI